MKEKVEDALGTLKGEDETWGDVFDRINTERGVDVKTIFKVLVCILEELDTKPVEEKPPEWP